MYAWSGLRIYKVCIPRRCNGRFLWTEGERERLISTLAHARTQASQKKWVVEWATSRNDPDLLGVDKYNIFVGEQSVDHNLEQPVVVWLNRCTGGLNPSEITKEMLQERFSSYGEIDTITLINR